MAYPAKTFYVVGCLAGPEASYGGGGSLAVGTDGVQLALDGGRAIALAYQEDFDGVKSYDIAAVSPLALLTPSARFLSGLELPFHFKGNTSAYSASVKPHLHEVLKFCGLSAAFSATPTPQWLYTPFSGTPGSGVLSLYTGGEKIPLTGVFGSLRIVAERGKPVMHFVRIWGLMGDVADDAGGAEALTIVYPSQSLDPVKADGIAIAIGSFVTPDATKVELEVGWGDPFARQLATANGAHGGFARDLSFNPRMRITYEKTALVATPFHTSAGLDPYQLRKTAQKLTGSSVSATFGSVQYSREKITFPQAQVAAPVIHEENGSIAQATIEIRPYASTPTANDAFQLLAN